MSISCILMQHFFRRIIVTVFWLVTIFLFFIFFRNNIFSSIEDCIIFIVVRYDTISEQSWIMMETSVENGIKKKCFFFRREIFYAFIDWSCTQKNVMFMNVLFVGTVGHWSGQPQPSVMSVDRYYLFIDCTMLY